jgi:tRNA 2-selenouridine synthase
MQAHYDPRYAKHRARSEGARHVLTMESLTPEAIAATARQLAHVIDATVPSGS